MKKKLIYGIFAMIFGIGLSAANVSATSYDPTGVAGALPNQPAAPLILNHGSMGDALLGEFYRAVVDDTIGGTGPVNFVTYISIENTSPNWVAAHVRLRSGRYSIEVIDFPILLSPRDVFWFQFEAVPSAIPGEPSAIKIWSLDKDTIEKSGLPSFTGADYDPVTGELVIELQPYILQQFTKLSAEYKTALELTQGYIEVFGLFALNFPAGRDVNPDHNFFNVMGQLWGDAIGDAFPTGTGVPGYCEDPVLGMFPLNRVPAIDVGKVLTGHVFMGDFTNGLYTGYTMKAIKDFRSPTTQTPGVPALIDRRDFFIRGLANGGGLAIQPATILYNYGGDAAYLEPDWATSFGPTWNDGDNTVGAPISAVDSFSLDEVDDAMVKQRLESTYFNGGFASTYTVVTVTAPTKYLHYFYNNNSGIFANTGVNPLPGDWHWPVGMSTTKAMSVRAQLDLESSTRGIGSLGLEGEVWNQAQKCPRDPSPFTGTILDWEVNLIPIGEASLAALYDFCYLMVTDLGSPFINGIDPATYPAGMFAMRNFTLQGPPTGGDPRNNAIDSVAGYNRALLPLLNQLGLAPLNLTEIIPVSGQIMDFEFTNFPHARTFDFSWDNIAW